MKNIKFDSAVFDVDSTLVTIEGLDFLAELKHKEEELSKITKAAMGGSMSMRDAMEIKMKTIAPSYKDLVRMGQEYIKNVTPGAIETIKILKKHLIKVWVLTGNFNPAVLMLAEFLGIDSNKVLTNKIYFDSKNNYLKFDLDNPLSNNGGKSVTVNKYKNSMRRTVLIGDGSTDLDTKGVVDLFIGYGGVVYRSNVEKDADVYVKENNLQAIIPYIIMQN